MTLFLYIVLVSVTTGFSTLELILFFMPVKRHESQGESKRDTVFKPLVSVFLCVRNEEENISNCIKTLLNQDYENFELLISDDESSDNTREIIESFSDSRIYFFSFGRAEQESDMNPKARQLVKLFPYSKGELLAIADGDCIYETSWLSELYNAMHEGQYDLVSGLTSVAGGGFQNQEWLGTLGRLNRFQFRNSLVAVGHNMLFKKDKLLAVGGFEKTVHSPTEDMKLNSLFIKSGFRTFLQGSLLVTTLPAKAEILVDQRKRWLSGLKEVPGYIRMGIYIQGALPVVYVLLFIFLGAGAIISWGVYTLMRVHTDRKILMAFKEKKAVWEYIIYELYRQVYTTVFFFMNIFKKKYEWKKRKYSV